MPRVSGSRSADCRAMVCSAEEINYLAGPGKGVMLIKLGKQEIHFKFAAPSRLYWADRPAMRVVQALYWMQDMLSHDDERDRVGDVLRRLFADPKHGEAIRDDLRAGLSALPIWMQEFLRDLVTPVDTKEAEQ